MFCGLVIYVHQNFLFHQYQEALNTQNNIVKSSQPRLSATYLKHLVLATHLIKSQFKFLVTFLYLIFIPHMILICQVLIFLSVDQKVQLKYSCWW